MFNTDYDGQIKDAIADCKAALVSCHETGPEWGPYRDDCKRVVSLLEAELRTGTSFTKRKVIDRYIRGDL